MNVAIVHDYLSQRGGAERVVLHLASMFGGSPIFTSLYAAERTYDEFRDLEVVTSHLQGRVDPQHFRRAVLRYPGAFRRLPLGDAERVVVSSSAFAHHIRHPRSLVYCHTPPRFLYDPEAYFRGRAAARAARAALAPLRRQDRRAALGHVAYVANSEVTARRIAKTYGRVAPVVYPPLATAHLPSRPQPLPSRPRALVVARLLPYKRIEVAIAACAAARIPLTVVGEGPDEPRLRRLASGHVDFAGWLDDDRLAEVFVSHSVVLAPGVEDFGFGPVEASFAGRPVVAVAAGGALETVRDGVTGRLVEGWDPGSWAAAITDVLSRRWSPTDLRGHTTAFGAEVFEGAIRQHLAAV